ncbi:hypothetical protein [Riemerella anatipestifer]|uniref:hypothetical protein n=1 Tax=Riemerella anatipestifer TaxID=34085 RepID=UPI001F2F7CFF|nr:hypothetical protein [Riemerella anatipestifer]MDY3333407.1 hypothetical protein [Riemerella anatipestifer]MDY3379656.1 hypothetical protein [Riemerella anatipestifer]MDY3383730.1 hypothetical protein [Riemerella anatipestifer]MEE3723985.1 hypothetical protein [Riemerella anatipestifer]WPC11300.1 hypothetical protein LEQ05_02695 [Riemerella anatipestifer]
MSTFNFSEFLMQKGFTFTNYGSHNLYELSRNEHNYCVNLQGEVMTTNESKTKDLKVDIPIPKNKTEAERWFKKFLG